ncbi:MAG: sugar phosphate nucleotidyltransferase [Nitrososphaeria archaeon]
MKIVFLCGGIGKRMFPIVKDKFLLKFLGKTLLEHHIEQALDAGFRDFVIIGNPSNVEPIRKICDSMDLNAAIFVQKSPKGMADALLTAKDYLLNDEILVVNPNDIFDKKLYNKILVESGKGEYSSFITGYRVSKYFPGGYLVVNDKLELLSIHEKPGEGNEPSDLVNIVVHLHKDVAKLFNYIEKTCSPKDDVYECALTKMISEGIKVKVIEYSGNWVAIKYPWHIHDVVKYFLDSIKTPLIKDSVKVSDNVQIHGTVIIDDNVKLLEGAIVKGPCYIGKNTVVGNNVLIRDYSHIGANCSIGYSTEITRSYIGDNCFFHSNFIGDSIVCDNCLFGYGTITANYRLDQGTVKVNVNESRIDSGRSKLGAIVGEGTRIGVGCMIMPGVRLGPNSVIGPGIIVYGDVGPNKKVLLKQEYTINSIGGVDDAKKL